MEDPATEEKKRKVGTAGAQADAIEAESPAEDKAEGGEKREKAANQGPTTTSAPKAYTPTRSTTTKAAPLPESSTADLASAARAQKTASKPAPKTMDEMSDDEVDAAAEGTSLGLKAAAVAYRKQHPRKTAKK